MIQRGCTRCVCIKASASAIAILALIVAIGLVLLVREYKAEASGGAPVGSFPVIINTWAFANATKAGWTNLLANGSALDAVVQACSKCEEEQCDHTVGWGGSPDENGETTLDAMIMDGPTHSVGSVAALRRVKNAISVARAVLEHTKHSMLVGELATQFALQMGFTPQNLTSRWSAEQHLQWLSNKCQPNFWRHVTPDSRKSCGPYAPLPGSNDVYDDKRPKVDRLHHDTIGVVAIDAAGRLASGTSTNGAKFKIAGRVGDSPIAGAGSYVDQDIGGAAATGDGDIIMRYLVSYQAVENLRQGMTPDRAAAAALSRLVKRYPQASVGVVVLDARDAQYGAACINVDGGFPYMVGSARESGEVVKKVVQCIVAPQANIAANNLGDKN